MLTPEETTIERLSYRVGYLESGLRRLADRDGDAARLWDRYVEDCASS